ncbi:ABC transporter permease [Haloplanus halophilus]|uniref:ABC transporter permease n=1 Tax=Haloplanus halophilus TaxID=2949993 RepID=UPI00203C3E79|nr:ABC transporter permease subunit [Haloplanus sp. GDY1]
MSDHADDHPAFAWRRPDVSWRRRLDDLLPWLLSGPLVALYALFLGLPLLRLVRLSLDDEAWIGANYAAVFLDPTYRTALVTSLAIAALVTAVAVVLGLFMAYFIARRDLPGERVIVAVISFPISLPGILVAWAVIVLVGRTGVLTRAAAAVTGGDPSGYSVAFGLVGLLIGYVYFTLPRTTMSLVGAIEKVDPTVEEAARSLGASPRQTFRHVTLPAILPGIASAVVLAFSVSMAAFGTALLLASGTVDILPLKIYSVILGTYDYGAGSAMAIVLTAITVGVIYGYARLFGGAVYE